MLVRRFAWLYVSEPPPPLRGVVAVVAYTTPASVFYNWLVIRAAGWMSRAEFDV